MIRSIHTDEAPKVVGPYSQAIVAGDFIFCSGQVGIDPVQEKLVEGIENQTKQAVENLRAVLKGAGSDLYKVVKTTIFLADIKDYATVNTVYGSYFPDTKPARSTVQVANLPAGALVEIEAVAVK